MITAVFIWLTILLTFAVLCALWVIDLHRQEKLETGFQVRRLQARVRALEERLEIAHEEIDTGRAEAARLLREVC